MKLDISLAAGYAGSESDLISLKNVVPNGQFQDFAGNPITHTPSARRLNKQLAPESGIKRTKKKEAEAKVDLKKEDDGLGEHVENEGRHVLPDGADMYYGLIPIEHNPITHMVLSSGVNTVVKIKSESGKEE
jgi:hypothetical protein